MTGAIPTQRIDGLSRREQAVVDDVLARAAKRLRFAQLTARTDFDDAQEQVENICLYVTREVYRLLGPQRCAMLDQPLAFRGFGNAIIDGARQVDGAL